MVYYQRSIPNPNKSLSFTLNNFVGGLNNRSQEPGLNQSVDMMNMRFTEDGFLEKRKGIKAYDEFNVGAPITFMDYYKPYKSAPLLVRSSDSKLYFDEEELDVQGQVMGLTHMGLYLFVDTKGMYCYGVFDVTANDFTSIIGTVPTTAVSLEVINPPSGFTPTPKPAIKGKTVYNFTNMTVHYEPCLYEIEDTSKGANVLPTTPAYIIDREGRVYIAGSEDNDDTIYISDVSNPFYFPVLLSLQVPPNSDRIRGLCLYNNTVLVGREHDIFVIRGDTNNTALQASLFTLQQLSAHTGLANQRTFISAHNYTFYLGSDGQFYIVRTLDTNSDALATSLISRDIDLNLHPLNINPEDYANASARFFKDSYYVAIGDKVLIYHYNHQAWTVYNQIDASYFLRNGTELLIGTNSGDTVTGSDNYMNLDKPYKAYWKSRYLDMDDSSSFKFFREFFVVSRTFENYTSEVRFRFEIDYSDYGAGINVKNKLSIWGISKFGDRFINKNINFTMPFQIGRRGRLLQMYYEGGYDIMDEVATFDDLPLRPEGERGSILFYVIDEDAYYLLDDEWRKLDIQDYNQPMRVQQISGFYEMRGRRY